MILPWASLVEALFGFRASAHRIESSSARADSEHDRDERPLDKAGADRWARHAKAANGFGD